MRIRWPEVIDLTRNESVPWEVMPEAFKYSVPEIRWRHRVCENNPRTREDIIRKEIRWIAQEILNRVVDNFNV